jgi:YaiO family outer membrane protein
MRIHFIYAPILFACAAAAHAGDSKPSLANVVDNKISLSTSYSDYSGAFGKRWESSAEWSRHQGRTAFVVTASHAKREFEQDSFSAVRLSGTVYHDWSDRVYTRTSAGVSANKPVFASREISNDFNFKPIPGAVVTVGGKYARYYGGRDVLSWSAGGTWYFGRGFANYRFSSFDVDKLGKSHSHLATFRLKDGGGKGYTQMWLGSGTSLHEQEPFFAGRPGKYRSIALQRSQPVARRVSIQLAVGRSSYDTTAAKYHGTNVSIGLAFNGWPAL